MRVVLAGGLVARTARGPVESTDLVVDGERVGSDARGAQRVDVSGCLVVPGHVCAHHHLYSALARGMPGPGRAPRSFVEILELVWWRLDRALDLDTIRLSALLGATEAARCGTTAIVDHHASPNAIGSSLDAVADGIAEAGVRGVVCYEVSDRHGEASGRRGVEENVRFVHDNRRALVRGMMGAHASFTIGERTLDHLVEEARRARIPVHVHVAEDGFDERHSLDHYGVRTAARLRRAGALDHGDLAAHGVCLDDDEIALVRSSGAWVAHNPRSNMNNGVGYAPVAALGERVVLGTDGLDGDMFTEARAAFLKARDARVGSDPGRALGWLAAGAGLVGSVFGLASLGRLEPGAPADLAVLEYLAPTPLEHGNLAGHYLFGLGAGAVRDVMVGGRWIVRERRHQLVDEDELAAGCRAAAPRLWDRMRDL
ncbi:MAG TPA: amidohydrolase family protein [Actinomycetota bacterium]|nr:amidohydrolase family protein [Actinomycetota bacterium]